MTAFNTFLQNVTDDIEGEGFIPYITRKFNQLLDDMFMLMSNSRLMRVMFGISSEDIANTQANRVISNSKDTGNVDTRTAAEKQKDIERLTTGGVPLFGLAGGRADAPIMGAIDIMNKYLDTNAPNRKNPIGFNMSDQTVYQNLSRQLQNKDEEDLIAMFGPKYEQVIANMVKELNEYKKSLDENSMFNGTMGAYGSVLKDFGPGTVATLHGKEAVLNEPQLNNLVANAYNQGAKQQGNQETNTQTSGSSNLVNKLVDSNREGSVKLLDALNMLTRKMDTQNNLTKQVIATVEQYS
jgi:hypothetical protein